MFVYTIGRKPVKVIFIMLLALSIIMNVFLSMQNRRLKSSHNVLSYIVFQLKGPDRESYATAARIPESAQRKVEIFDIAKGEVIKEVQPGPEIKKEILKYINGITGMYVKVNAIPVKGYIVRVPVTPAIPIQNSWLNDYGINSLNEVFVLFPEKEKPFLLILNNESRPYFYNFEGDTNKLLEILGFSL